MKPTASLAAILAGCLCLAPALAQTPEDLVRDVVEARRALMLEIGTLTERARAEAAGTGTPGPQAQETATALAAALAAFPHLFPPESDLQGAAGPLDGVSTTAAPGIWEDFSAFYGLAQESVALAREMAVAQDLAAYADRFAAIEAACGQCHESFVYYDPFAFF